MIALIIKMLTRIFGDFPPLKIFSDSLMACSAIARKTTNKAGYPSGATSLIIFSSQSTYSYLPIKKAQQATRPKSTENTTPNLIINEAAFLSISSISRSKMLIFEFLSLINSNI